MDERIECDVLIAGSGAAGFATAITAAHHGLDVIMVEKESVFGGTTAFSAGVIWIPCNGHARRLGIVDSRADALTYLEHEIGNRLDRAKAEAFVDNGAAMLDFFERHSHVRYLLQTIPGLHAVGNDMASMMGGTYPGAGITIGPAMTFGYIAGRHLAGVAD